MGRVHLFVAVCDHFEPAWRTNDAAVRLARAQRWRDEYPRLARRYRDSDGRHPRHTFFVPIEDLLDCELDALGDLCRNDLAEIEVHLHHEHDDEMSLRRRLEGGVTRLADEGHLARADDGRPRFAFIHGNWALGNAQPDGRHCGVDEEFRALFASGCYADFTFPAFPDASQARRVNRLDWPSFDSGLRRAADRGWSARVGAHYADRVLLVHGPLVVSRRAGAFALRVDYGALTAHDPATPERLDAWLKARVHVEGNYDYQFLKLHTHGAPEAQASSLLGNGGVALHEALATLVRRGTHVLHYVTARELYNVATGVMLGIDEELACVRDFILPPPPISRARQGT